MEETVRKTGNQEEKRKKGSRQEEGKN